MKRWAAVTILLYAAAFVALVAPVALAAFWPRDRIFIAAFGIWPVWGVWLGLMVMSQVAMLALPVRLAQRRPVTRIWIFWPMLAAGGIFLILAVGMGCVAWEVATRAWGNVWNDSGWLASWSMIAGVAGFWIIWAIAFGFFAGKSDPQGLIRRIVR